MTPYTVQDTPAIRRRIDRDLQRATETVRAGDSHLRALVLTGGFARAEGTVMHGAPQNDYDFVAVRGAGSSRPYPEMAKELADELGLAIDLKPVWSRRLRWTAPSIFWYETALRGRVLWGDEGVLDRIPIRHPSRIHRGEGMRLLSNRAAGLLLACGPGDDAKRIQACKALLGTLDAHLLSRGLFPPTHVERWDVYQDLLRTNRLPMWLRAHAESLRWAYLFKTRPDAAPLVDPESVWNASASALLAALPATLRHAGAPNLDAYARRDAWPERLHYWSKAWPLGKHRWMLHPSSHTRVATLRALEAKRHPDQVDPASVTDVAGLRDLRLATLQ